uniref:(California timema) hypothetical protein n=1 Tax=Timema californicum TaxID=61474 RepID=A0A7R9J762_TIMCA|nr:unnamed protein product [Timema californicum]
MKDQLQDMQKQHGPSDRHELDHGIDKLPYKRTNLFRWPHGLVHYSNNRLAAEDREIRVRSRSGAEYVRKYATEEALREQENQAVSSDSESSMSDFSYMHIEFRVRVPAFASREKVENHFWKNHHQYTRLGLDPNLTFIGSLVSHESGGLDHVATKAGPPPLPVHPTEIRTSISPSSAVDLNKTCALANYATKAERERVILFMDGYAGHIANNSSRKVNCSRPDSQSPYIVLHSKNR